MRTNAVLQDTVSERERRNQALAFELAAESIVLLENDGVLPLQPCTAALFGAGAAYTIQGGSGSGEVNVRHAVNVLEGLENAGFTITTKDWITKYDRLWKEGKEAYIRAFRKKLLRFNVDLTTELMTAEYRYPSGDPITEDEIHNSETDTCIYVVSRQSGEGYDRKDEAGSFRLTDTEIENIRICADAYARFILVLNAGAVLDLSPLAEISGINALVYMNQLGMEGGNALAAVLTGSRVPSGKLAVTWAHSYSDYPFTDTFGHWEHTRYKEGIYVGYRWFDSFLKKPLYPFGYGLGYTQFKLETTDVSAEKDMVRVSVNVTNTGETYKGKEVVQVYVSCPQDGEAKEYQRLAAFAKTKELAPGESEELVLCFPLSRLSSYSEEKAETYLEAGAYIVRIGKSSKETIPAAKLILSKRIVLSRHRNLCVPETPVSELHENKVTPENIPDTIPVISVDPDIETMIYTYALRKDRISARTEQVLYSLSVQEMLGFCAGTGLFGENRGFCVPGAVGHTTAAFLDRGIPNRELCDGPAGLRIQRRSTINKKGRIKAVDQAISLYEFLPERLTGMILGDPEKETVLYQFVTGFPVAAAVAQSWNTALAEEMGRALSEEMKEYGVTWWLAPALNIVRNPLCGRNFEYYSEDPLLSGKFAAAVTRGVQEKSGCFVTIKHFAANNQEGNRMYNSSDVDEKTLREIYLRGFEIAVREAAPKAVMSAYNKINDVYCANNRELCTDILRGEWGFEGIVMTDWLSTAKDRADEAECLNAGVDLIMPGGISVVNALRKAYRKGQLRKETVCRCCARVLEQILTE